MGRCWSPTAGPTRCSCRASGRGWCAPVAGSSAPMCGLIGRSVKGGEPDGRARPHQRSQDTKARSAPALELETGLHQARGLKVDSRPRSYPSYGYVHPEPRPAILRTPGLPGASRASWFRSGSLPVAPPNPFGGLLNPDTSAPYAKRPRARMTVLADQGAPVGVSTWRAFNSVATARADIPANSERIGAMARARSAAPACRISLIAGSRGPPSLTPRALAAASPALVRSLAMRGAAGFDSARKSLIGPIPADSVV